jgi:hypothetical protein
LIALGAAAARRWALGWAAATVAGYLGGFYLTGFFFQFFPPQADIPLTGVESAWRFALSRLWFAGPIAVVLLVVWLVFAKRVGAGAPAFGFGNWLVRSRDMIAKEPLESWLRKLFFGYLLFVAVLFVAVLFVAVLFVLVQLPVGFAPIMTGSL